MHAQRQPFELSLRDLGHGLSFGSALSFTGFAIVYASPIVRGLGVLRAQKWQERRGLLRHAILSALEIIRARGVVYP